MSCQKVLIDPLTRIEGHLSIEMDVQDGKVVDAKCRGDMYRGFESILQGRNPVDAQQIVMRICGVCPVSHGQASSKCLEDAFKIKPAKNGRLLRNLLLGANFLQSHILHFYHLAALDFVDITAILQYKGSDSGLIRIKDWVNNEFKVKKGRVDELTAAAPFLPRYEGKDFYIKDVAKHRCNSRLCQGTRYTTENAPDGCRFRRKGTASNLHGSGRCYNRAHKGEDQKFQKQP